MLKFPFPRPENRLGTASLFRLTSLLPPPFPTLQPQVKSTFLPAPRSSSDTNETNNIYNVCFVLLPTDDESSSGSSSCWWPCWYLPDTDCAMKLQESLYQRRLEACQDEDAKEQLREDLKQCQRQLAFETIQRFASDEQGSPVWLRLGDRRTAEGPATYPVSAIAQFISTQDYQFVSKAVELWELAKTNPELESAMTGWVKYRKWVKTQQRTLPAASMAAIPAPVARTTEMSVVTQGATTAMTSAASTKAPMEESRSNEDHPPPEGDSATVVTASSASAPEDNNINNEAEAGFPPVGAGDDDEEDDASTKQHEPEPKKAAASKNSNRSQGKSSQGRKRGHPKTTTPSSRSSKRVAKRTLSTRSSKSNEKTDERKDDEEDSNATPVTGHRRKPTAADDDEEDNIKTPRTTGSKEARIGGSSAKYDRQAWQEVSRGPSGNVSPVSQQDVKQGTARQVFPPAAKAPTTAQKPDKAPDSPVPEEASKDKTDDSPGSSSDTQSTPPEEPPLVDDNMEPQRSILPQEPEPLLEVELPGTTNQEKLNSCLDALRKENERVVVCGKILTPRQRIHDFFTAVVNSKGANGPGKTVPAMHVCGAPGSGKTMTVEKCSSLVKDAFLQTCDEEWDAPPKFCYVNCSHLQNRSKAEALRMTMDYAGTNENGLKRPSDDQDCRKPTVIFILDEIDYLISNNRANHSNSNKAHQLTKSEEYIQNVLNWASSARHMVGVIGISNSVENEKAARLVDLGFPRSNKVVFGTYDEKDLTHIALSKIGKSVVDEKAIKLLSKRVAASSGDARKFLEILSRSIMGVMDGMSEETLNSRHEKTLIGLPHIMKTFTASTIKRKDLVEGSPANEKAILCLCIHLAPMIRSRPIPLSTLLEVCRGGYDALEVDTESELKSILERLLDSGLLKLLDRRIPANNKIRFDSQLEDVETAVEEVLMKTSYYGKMVEKLVAMEVGDWTF